MDEINERILHILSANSRTPNVEIAERLGVSEGTVRKRIEFLLASGIISSFTIHLSTKTGISAAVLIRVGRGKSTSEVCQKIRHSQGVSEVMELSGPHDILAIVRGETTEQLNATIDSIRSIKGVMETDTRTVLKYW